MTTNETNYLQKIANEYKNPEKSISKIEQVKELDRKVKRPAEIFAYTFGIVSSLIFGLGMCLAMKVLGNMMILGIVIGVLGMGLISVNYPLYKTILKIRKKKYAKKIIELTDTALSTEI